MSGDIAFSSWMISLGISVCIVMTVECVVMHGSEQKGRSLA